MAAILMTSLLGPDAELRWANWFKLLQRPKVYFGIGPQKSSQNLHGMPIRHRLLGYATYQDSRSYGLRQEHFFQCVPV